MFAGEEANVRRCARCGKELPETEFCRDRTRPGELRTFDGDVGEHPVEVAKGRIARMGEDRNQLKNIVKK